jgi:hypothetical protein
MHGGGKESEGGVKGGINRTGRNVEGGGGSMTGKGTWD